jgi:arylsulfatase
VAEKYPEKLQELIHLWYAEAGKYGVFPLGDGAYLTESARPPKPIAVNVPSNWFYLSEQRFEYRDIFYPVDVNPKSIFNRRNQKIRVELSHKKEWEGILYAAGNRFTGYVLYIKDNRLNFVYNYQREQYFKAQTPELPEGKLELQMNFVLQENNTALVGLYVNGEQKAETVIDKFTFFMETHACIKNGMTSEITSDYKLPFEYPGKLDRVVLEAAPYVVDKETYLEEFFAID